MSEAEIRSTPLHDLHEQAGAKMVPFAGWRMPLAYGSQIEEHQAVRSAAGMFDVSHMTVLDVAGDDALPYLRRLIANDAGRLEPGAALYGAVLNDAGGVLDDLIVYRVGAGYRCVVNAATRDKMVDWFAAQRSGDVTVAERDVAMIAVQGPEARARFADVSGVPGVMGLAAFSSIEHGDWLVGGTGYTGEDGVEVMLPGADARDLWRSLTAAGVKPAGLAARDTLRLEAGLNLYGQDMDETTSPLVSNIAWTVAWEPGDRDFVGRAALEAERADGPAQKLTGLLMTEKGVLRAGQRVFTDQGDGVVTSGIFSPTLGCGIALARVPRKARGEAQVEIRNQRKAVRIVRPPFVKDGGSRFT